MTTWYGEINSLVNSLTYELRIFELFNINDLIQII
jgi:hypothetical protein